MTTTDSAATALKGRSLSPSVCETGISQIAKRRSFPPNHEGEHTPQIRERKARPALRGERVAINYLCDEDLNPTLGSRLKNLRSTKAQGPGI